MHVFVLGLADEARRLRGAEPRARRRARHRRRPRAPLHGGAGRERPHRGARCAAVFVESTVFKQSFLQNFANFWRARSRLYRNEILPENMRLTAFFKLSKICILLHRCNLKIFAKNRSEKLRISQNNF